MVIGGQGHSGNEVGVAHKSKVFATPYTSPEYTQFNPGAKLLPYLE